MIYAPSVSFTRPSNTTVYAAGQLIANSVTAASVVPLTWNTSSPSGQFYIAGCWLRKTTASITLAQFRVHFFSATPTIATTGDAGVFASVVTGASLWLGSMDGTMVASMANGAAVNCVPTEGLVTPVRMAEAAAIFALIEARAAYAPGNAEVFTLSPLIEQA